MTAPRYTDEDLATQAAAWFEAAHALRCGDKEEALRRLYPPMPDDHVIPMTCALCVVGVELTAAVMRRNVGAEVGEPIGVDVLAMAGTEPTAVTRLMCDLIREAAGTTPGQADVGKRVVEWITPKGAPLAVVANRSALLLAELLSLFAAVSQEMSA